jgi:drug/metabolite transporter (DMT)-like permease
MKLRSDFLRQFTSSGPSAWRAIPTCCADKTVDMSVLLALMAAAVYGVAVAFQHHEAAKRDPGLSLHVQLLLRLVVSPLWLIGLVGDIGGFALQTAALATGSLVVVQPVLTLSLVVSLLVGAWLGRRALRSSEWLAVAGTLSGLLVFLTVAEPTEHSDAVASVDGWLITVAAVAVAVVVTLVTGRRTSGVLRAMLFAFAAACAEALMAVIAKAFGDQLGRGVWATFTHWEPYAVVVCGLATVLVVQSAFHIGLATATLPVLTVAEPIVAMSIAAALFGEHVHVGGWRGPVVVASFAVMIFSLTSIARGSADSTVAAPVGKDVAL